MRKVAFYKAFARSVPAKFHFRWVPVCLPGGGYLVGEGFGRGGGEFDFDGVAVADFEDHRAGGGFALGQLDLVLRGTIPTPINATATAGRSAGGLLTVQECFAGIVPIK